MSEISSGQRHDRSALILYGSETGNSQDGAELLGRITQRLRFETTVIEMDLVRPNVLLQHTVVIFVVSTTGQGDIPGNARKFWKRLLRASLAPDYLSHVPFATFGFGDSSYVKFNWAARKLHKRLEMLGANEVYPRGEADEQHAEGTDGAFLPWSTDLGLHLLQRFALPAGLSPIPDSELLPPKWTVTLSEPLSDSAQPNPTAGTSAPIVSPALQSHQTSTANMDGPIRKTLCIKDPVSGDDVVIEEEALPPEDLLPIPDGIVVTCDQNKRITHKDHWQDVRLITFLADGDILYRPGDILTIYPKNFPEDVESLIKLQGWEDVADMPITISPTFKSYSDDSYIPRVANMHTVGQPTLRSLLINNLDITAIPRRYFFEIISKFTQDPMHRDRLLEFTNPVYSDEFFDYTTRPRRSILEVLKDFSSVRIPWYWAPSIFPELRGRKFSIASGGALRHHSNDITSIDICVAIVKYQTVLKKVRQGVCSRYLSSLSSNTNLVVSIDRSPSFKLARGDFERPILMIAPGTGVAPMRSLIWERAYRHLYDNIKKDKAVLIYGGRNAKADYLFSAEWKAQQLNVEVFTAFSRDQKEKRYVQDVIREQASLVHDMLVVRKGRVFVCGSSGKMPTSVRAAIVDAFMEVERKMDWNYSHEQAEQCLALMEKHGLYTQETW